MIESIAGKKALSVRKWQEVKVVGWAADTVKGAPIQKVELLAGGKVVAETTRFSPSQDFHFGPGTVKVYTRAAPNTTSFRAEPCT